MDAAAVIDILVGTDPAVTFESLRKTLWRMTQALGGNSHTVIVRRSGGYVAFDGQSAPIDPDEAAWAWRRASRGEGVATSRDDEGGEDKVVIPVPLSGPDAVTGEKLKAVLLLGGFEDPATVDEALNLKVGDRRLRTFIGRHFARLLNGLGSESHAAAVQRLLQRGNQSYLTRDIAYQVAMEIRRATKYDGTCTTFSWSEGDGALRPLAVLQSASGDRKDSTRERPAIAWLADIPLTALIDPARAVFLTTAQSSRLSITAIEQTAAGPRIVPGVSEDVRVVINALLRSIDGARLSPGQARLVLPIASGEEFLGVQVVSMGHPTGFTMRDIDLAARLTRFCVPTLARDRELVTEMEYLDTTAGFQPQLPLSDSQPLRSVLSLLAERIRKHRGADQVVIVPFDYRTQSIDADGIAAVGTDRPPHPQRDPTPGGVVERLLSSKEGSLECHLMSSEQGDPQWHMRDGGGDLSPLDFALSSTGFLEHHGTQSFYAEVLHHTKEVAEGRTVRHPVGFLFVDYSRPRGQATRKSEEDDGPRFSTADKSWIRFYANVVARYLATSQEVAARFKVDREVRSLYDRLSEQKVWETLDEDVAGVDALLKEILRVALELVQGTAGVLAVKCNEHRDLKVICSEGLDGDDEQRHISYGEGVTGYCAKTMSPVVISDSTDESTWPPGVKPLRWVEGSRCEMAVPLLTGGDPDRLIGVLNVESQRATGLFGSDEVSTLEQLARASALALELAGRIEQLRSLRQVGEAIDRAPDTEQAFEAVIGEAMRVTGAYAASARTIDPTGEMLDPVLHRGDPGQYQNQRISKFDGAVGWAYRKQRLCLIDDFENRSDIRRRYKNLDPIASREETRSELCVPITWGPDRIGVLNLEHVHAYGLSPYVEYVEALASQVAFVLAQRRSHVRKLRVRDEDLVRAVTQFASALAHDVVLRFRKIEEKVDAAVGNGALSLEQAEQLAREVKTAAEHGRLRAETLLKHASNPFSAIELVDVPDLVRDIAADYKNREVCVINTLEVESACGNADLAVRCRPAVLAWCVSELIDNSVAYARAGKLPKLDLAIDCAEPKSIGITVADDGPGVDEDELSVLFEPPWTSSHHRSGRGLALVRSFVDTMGGSIAASAPASGGLTVRIQLPRGDVPA